MLALRHMEIDLLSDPLLVHFFTEVSNELPKDFLVRYVQLEMKIRQELQPSNWQDGLNAVQGGLSALSERLPQLVDQSAQKMQESLDKSVASNLNAIKVDLMGTLATSLETMGSSSLSLTEKFHLLSNDIHSVLSTTAEKLVQTKLDTSIIASTIKDCLAKNDLHQSLLANQEVIKECIRAQTSRHENMKKKGNDYEVVFHKSMLSSSLFQDYEVEKTASKAHHGDFLLTNSVSPHIKITLDVKNWDSSKVTVKEVAKFRSDCLATGTNGILISKTTEIASKRAFDCEMIGPSEAPLFLFYVGCNNDQLREIAACLQAIVFFQCHMQKKDEPSQRFDPVVVQSMLDAFKSVFAKKEQAISHLKMAINNLTDDAWGSFLAICQSLDTGLTLGLNDGSKPLYICRHCQKKYKYQKSLEKHIQEEHD